MAVVCSLHLFNCIDRGNNYIINFLYILEDKLYFIPKSEVMNRLLIVLSALVILSCQQDDIKNIYSIKGIIGVDDIQFNGGFKTVLLSEDQVIATAEGSAFHFTGLEEGRSYEIVPLALINSGDGVSTLDWVLLDKHVQGEVTLDAIQQLAADVNKNEIISAEDMEIIRFCILGKNGCFSWRFVTQDYDGSGNGSVDHYSIPALFSDVEINFIPIKLGDLNHTIIP